MIVGSGDSLSKIAKREGVTVDEIMSINDITDPNLLFVGQELTISGRPSVESSEEDQFVDIKASDPAFQALNLIGDITF